jgi:TetR/AcrR family transcriptional repressor of nem operon
LEEFAKRGFDGPSLDSICEKAGYTRGAFYVHFRDRDDLVAAVMESQLNRLLDAVLGTDAEGADIAQTIDLYVNLSTRGRKRLDDFKPTAPAGPGEDVPLQRLLEACERAPAVREKFRQILGDSIDRVMDVVDRGIERNELRRDVGAREVSSLLVILALGLRVATDLELPIDVASTREALGRLLTPSAGATRQV